MLDHQQSRARAHNLLEADVHPYKPNNKIAFRILNGKMKKEHVKISNSELLAKKPQNDRHLKNP